MAAGGSPGRGWSATRWPAVHSRRRTPSPRARCARSAPRRRRHGCGSDFDGYHGGPALHGFVWGNVALIAFTSTFADEGCVGTALLIREGPWLRWRSVVSPYPEDYVPNESTLHRTASTT